MTNVGDYLLDWSIDAYIPQNRRSGRGQQDEDIIDLDCSLFLDEETCTSELTNEWCKWSPRVQADGTGGVTASYECWDARCQYGYCPGNVIDIYSDGFGELNDYEGGHTDFIANYEYEVCYGAKGGFEVGDVWTWSELLGKIAFIEFSSGG